MKFEFELDGIDTLVLYDMLNQRRLKYFDHLISASHDNPVCHERVSHLIGLIHNVDDIEAAVFSKPVKYMDLSRFDKWNTVTFEDDH